MASAPRQVMTAQQQNDIARAIILRTAIDSWQSVFTQTFTTGTGSVINIPLRNVGMVKRLIVEVSATISGSGGVTHTLTNLGGANFFSQIVLTDLSNQTRINTSGWHLTALSSSKARQSFGSAILAGATDSPFGYGSNYTNVNSAPNTITAAAAADNTFLKFEVPLAYSDFDLRGAIYANVVNATFNLQLTVNPTLLAISTDTDPVLSMYQSSTTTRATLPSFTITIYQNYLDQLPVDPNSGAPVLPYQDLSTAYLLNNTSVTGMVANQDYPIPYANFRDFMSTTLIYDNGGSLNAGTDINYFAIQAANYTNVIKTDVAMNALFNRLRMGMDFPRGMYHWDHRLKPISTIQYGNQQLIVNPSAVSANSAFLLGYEALAQINQVVQAGSLVGG